MLKFNVYYAVVSFNASLIRYMQLNAPPLPGSITITGATVDRSKFVNGNFELTDEICNDKPVYRKRGDATTWLEAVSTTTGTWRWYVKPTSARGPDKSVCFGYGTCETLKDPHECDTWYVYDDSKFVVEETVTCVQEPLYTADNGISNSSVVEERNISQVIDFDFEIEMPEDTEELPECPDTPAF